MKITIKKSWFVIAALLAWVGCIKTPEEPVININEVIPIGKIYTLSELKMLEMPYTFDTAASVYATVSMDEINGNLYKQIYVQDATDGIRIVFTEATRYAEGDSLRIYLKGKTILNNNGTYEIRTLQPDSTIITLATKKHIVPIDATISEINLHKYDLKLVRLSDVEFNDGELGKTWADTTLATSAENRTLKDCENNTLVVRTSSYAAFAGNKVPTGKGSVVGIVSVYGTTMQFLVRSMPEINMNDVRCDGSSGNEDILLNEPFDAGTGKFTIIDKLGDQKWEWDSRYGMKMSGYNGTNFANEDWLVSPAIALADYKIASMSFDHAGRYASPFSQYFTLWISTDYKQNSFNDATWEQLIIPQYMTGDDWTFVNSGKIDLSKYAGYTVYFAFKYLSSNSTAGTWEIKNVMVKGNNLLPL
jgi:hypothetical protein